MSTAASPCLSGAGGADMNIMNTMVLMSEKTIMEQLFTVFYSDAKLSL